MERLASPVQGAVEDLRHADIALEVAYLHGFLDADLGLGCDVSDRRLDDGFLSQRWEHLCDVAQERPARSENEHAITGQTRMVVEKKRRSVEADCGLAGSRTSLDGQELLEGRTDDLVLFRLNGGDDVEHFSRPSSLQLGEERVAPAQPRRLPVVARPTEEVVRHRDD